MLYTLKTPLLAVKGIGPSIAAALEEYGLVTVKDFLLHIPYKYEDRSQKKLISELQPGELITIVGEVTAASNFYKGRRSIQSATIKDETGRVKLMWFNNPHVITKLKKGETFLVSGKLSDKGMIVQPVVESFSQNTIHTGRLVPIYSSIPDVAPATLRKLQKEVVDHLRPLDDPLQKITNSSNFSLPHLNEALQHIHFPDSEEKITISRERFAVEELLGLIEYSHQLKELWKKGGEAIALQQEVGVEDFELPFALTHAQQRCCTEILDDLSQKIPMNRLLIGDVGSGKTAVCGIASAAVLQNGQHVCLVSPTQILAEQHMSTFQKLFPHLPVEIVTSKTSKRIQRSDTPTLYIGTHAVLNKFEALRPALIIYDEQHRFGVGQRSRFQDLTPRPHVLTLSATPIPRTLMLSIFSHLNLSVIDEMPPGRKPVTTWLVPEKKRADSYKWIYEQLHGKTSSEPLSDKAVAQCLVVCPFIDPSKSEALENIAAASETFEKIQKSFTALGEKKSRVALLHGRMSKKQQQEITTELFDKNIDILVTTPIVEVGVDLPAATIIIIEAAERFGLASLHQLRGRVGRAGQQAYCLLFTTSSNKETLQRLKQFCETHDGMKLAEHDLQRRGAGDIFGTQQHGFDELQFANWTNLELIAKTKKLADLIEKQHITWQPFIEIKKPPTQDSEIPLAN